MSINIYENSYIKKFADCITELRTHTEIDISTLRGNENLYDKQSYSLDYINQEASLFAKDYGYEIPDNVKEIATFPVHPLTVSWRYIAPNAPHQIAGGFSIREINTCFDFEENHYKIYNEDIDETTKSLMKIAYYFDVQPDVSWQLATLFINLHKSDFPELWYLAYQKLYKLEVSLKEYLDILLITKGIMHWQFFLCSKEKYPQEMNLNQKMLSRILEYLPQIFPNQDYTPIIKRYNVLYQ